MFILSKIVGVLTDVLSVLALCFATGWALAAHGRFRAWGRGLMIVSGLTALFITVIPVETILIQTLEDRFPAPSFMPERVDGIIVLGGGINPIISASRSQISMNGAVARLTTAIALSRRFPEARVIYTGGSGDMLDQRFREADYAKEFLVEIGIDAGRIIFENESRNTRENALFSREIIKPVPGETWLLVTSASHMPRSVGCFRAVGWPVVAYPVDYRTMKDGGFGWRSLRFSLIQGAGGLSAALHEYLGLVSYYRLGWTDTLFPAP